METVQIQCGSCHRVMAISVEHLGSQVHCPHCQAIVQAPPPRPPEVRTEPAAADGETESIFSPPAPTDDIFDSGPPGQLVEMPLEKIRAAPPDLAMHEADTEPAGTMPYLEPVHAKEPPAFRESSEPQASSAPAWTEASTIAHEAPADDANLAAMQPRRVAKSSALAPILLIFLIPYALLATGVIAYLLINQSRPYDPLERLPDPKPKDGGPRLQVAHDSPLPAKLKTRFSQALRIGAVEVTPLKVQATANNELVLNLRLKNISTDQVFNPISFEFMKYVAGALTGNRPYTYLDLGEKKLYGGFPEWLKGPPGKEEPFGGEIAPGQEELIRIVTEPKYKAEVKRLAKSKEDLVWRVQVRRGFVDVRGTLISATAVVGVEFNAASIEKEG